MCILNAGTVASDGAASEGFSFFIINQLGLSGPENINKKGVEWTSQGYVSNLAYDCPIRQGILPMGEVMETAKAFPGRDDNTGAIDMDPPSENPHRPFD